MCVYSNVIDHYWPQFEPWIPNWPQSAQPTFIPDAPTPEQTKALERLIKDFYEAIAAAKTVDTLTAQPDCEDPEKANLVDRVAALEKEIAALKRKRRAKGTRPKAAP